MLTGGRTGPVDSPSVAKVGVTSAKSPVVLAGADGVRLQAARRC